MRGGHLSNPEVARLLKPFVVTSWHGADPAQMPPDVRQVYTASEIPKNTNVYMFLLDQHGQLVHSFHGLQGRRNTGSSYQQEIGKARAILKLPDEPTTAEDQKLDVRLPDLAMTGSGVLVGRIGNPSYVPAGLRLFLRPNNQGASKQLVVEVVAMKPEEWKVLSFSERAKPIEPEALKNWLVQMYPPAIRTVDQKKPFTRITGSLTLEPAGSDTQGRYALLRGEVSLAKGDDNESAFQGTLEAVLTYRPDAPEVQSLRGVVAGDYLYRIRGPQTIPLIAAIESRPEPRSPSIDPEKRPGVSGDWVGTWGAYSPPKDGAPPPSSQYTKEQLRLDCRVAELRDGKWEATFEGECGRPYKYTIKMAGRQVGDVVLFQGSADLGEKDGGVYDWIGRATEEEFIGFYTSRKYTGHFRLARSKEDKPAPPADEKKRASQGNGKPKNVEKLHELLRIGWHSSLDGRRNGE